MHSQNAFRCIPETETTPKYTAAWLANNAREGLSSQFQPALLRRTAVDTQAFRLKTGFAGSMQSPHIGLRLHLPWAWVVIP
jgi:hypothetical protein